MRWKRLRGSKHIEDRRRVSCRTAGLGGGDYLAGVWAHHAQAKWNVIEPGNLEEAINAAHAIGDDRLQRQVQGYVVPASFTHGTSEQRARWFLKGLKSGDMSGGNTFEIEDADL